MQYLLPAEIIQLDESKEFLEILSEKDKKSIATSSKRGFVVLTSDSHPTMQQAFMAIYACIHGKSYPEFFDFLHNSAKNSFVHEQSKRLFKCYSPKQIKDSSNDTLEHGELIGEISHEEVKDYFYKQTLSNLNVHIDLDL